MIVPPALGAAGMSVFSSAGSATEPPVGSGGGGGWTGVADTATVAFFETLPLVAVTVAVPSATAATRPVADTVTTLALLDDHFTVGLEIGFPEPSRTTAVNCTDWPSVSVGAVALSEIALAWIG
jgi:hypothetical protein